ncbi:hypothetical protein [Paenibacillus jilunlii]|uniref:Uncharacterized protein n=1 Tax=Paenibacillus jilunlii TaxID=682956 RepID=A0A1G9RBG4_9BACL|nr:hypothetical protein [Paenibacillus jilunlii]KWX76708.1 hypothetical protein AML91_09400 [Paenibacillus jilunlii]SDM20568.1 hypothetical protein SAMN05216191_11037 [Paenibacillus jilunlii]
MENLTAEEKQQLVEAFKSIIRKSEKALSHMKTDAPQTRLLEKRMKAAQIGAETLLARWEGREMDVCKTDLIGAKKELESLLLTLPSFLKKSKEGSGQRTYITRRIEAIKVAVFYMDDLIEKIE